MKKLIVILGSNGVGKSTTAKAFMNKYTKCAYVDADWCRAINPFPFTPSTKKAVTENIYCILRNYLLCGNIDKIVFPYSFHGEIKGIFDTVICLYCTTPVLKIPSIFLTESGNNNTENSAFQGGKL